MPNPVDIRQFMPISAQRKSDLRRELQIPPDAQVVLFVGRLAPEKEIPSLIRAFASVRIMHKSAQLVLIGDGPDRAQLERCIAESELPAEAVRFAGRLPVASVINWLQASDVFALVSSNEGFPCSLVEAMAVGLPSVVSDIPANVQLIVHNENGLLAAQRNEDGIAAALDRLLSDEPLRRRLGAAARLEVVEKYSVEKVIARYEQLFQEVLAG
jgi:glycosyltransferase involved in cell wall biosynthesis